MSTKAISQANLDGIERSINTLVTGIQVLETGLAAVDNRVGQVTADVTTLTRQFQQFVIADKYAKNLQNAKTDIIAVRQELETNYGHYAEIRRLTTGILQATDASIISQSTITAAAEDQMIQAPRYWLAPALVALAAWLRDEKLLAEKALTEAQRRSDEKTSLFFALICRRAMRDEACREWIEHYLTLQNPNDLGRQSIILLDAVVSGIFGSGVRAICGKHVSSWITDLSTEPEFVSAQRKQWADAFASKYLYSDYAQKYPYLQRYGTNWKQFEEALNAANVHQTIKTHFEGIFEGEVPVPHSLLARVDDVLNNLVSSMDDEELPFRRQERLNHLIIEFDGNKEQAQTVFKNEEKALDERVNFTQLLTNIAMYPDISQTSRMTQRFAIALSKEWAIEAYNDFTAAVRQREPLRAVINIENWTAETQDGSDEAVLESSLRAEIKRREEEELAKAKHGILTYLLVAAGVLVFGKGLIDQSMFIIGGGILLLICAAVKYQAVKKTRKAINDSYNTLTEQTTQTLRAVLAELVDWRRDFGRAERISMQVSEYLDAISPGQHALASTDKGRQIMV